MKNFLKISTLALSLSLASCQKQPYTFDDAREQYCTIDGDLFIGVRKSREKIISCKDLSRDGRVDRITTYTNRTVGCQDKQGFCEDRHYSRDNCYEHPSDDHCELLNNSFFNFSGENFMDSAMEICPLDEKNLPTEGEVKRGSLSSNCETDRFGHLDSIVQRTPEGESVCYTRYEIGNCF